MKYSKTSKYIVISAFSIVISVITISSQAEDLDSSLIIENLRAQAQELIENSTPRGDITNMIENNVPQKQDNDNPENENPPVKMAEVIQSQYDPNAVYQDCWWAWCTPISKETLRAKLEEKQYDALGDIALKTNKFIDAFHDEGIDTMLIKIGTTKKKKKADIKLKKKLDPDSPLLQNLISSATNDVLTEYRKLQTLMKKLRDELKDVKPKELDAYNVKVDQLKGAMLGYAQVAMETIELDRSSEINSSENRTTEDVENEISHLDKQLKNAEFNIRAEVAKLDDKFTFSETSTQALLNSTRGQKELELMLVTINFRNSVKFLMNLALNVVNSSYADDIKGDLVKQYLGIYTFFIRLIIAYHDNYANLIDSYIITTLEKIEKNANKINKNAVGIIDEKHNVYASNDLTAKIAKYKIEFFKKRSLELRQGPGRKRLWKAYLSKSIEYASLSNTDSLIKVLALAGDLENNLNALLSDDLLDYETLVQGDNITKAFQAEALANILAADQKIETQIQSAL